MVSKLRIPFYELIKYFAVRIFVSFASLERCRGGSGVIADFKRKLEHIFYAAKCYFRPIQRNIL